MSRLQNKLAVITGGNSGIGKGIAKKYYEEGAKIVIFGRNPETLESAKSDIGSDILTVGGDVTSADDLKRLYQEAENHFHQKVDIVVANAGMGERLNIRDVTEEKFDKMVNINYRGCYFTVKYALPHINETASIVLISSIAGHVSVMNHSVYASTKAAVRKLAQNLTNDLGPDGIRVNSISPGYIQTPIFDNRLEDDPDYLKRRATRIPLRRIGTPEDIANAALFLASDEASYVTGTDLIVDGGYISTFAEA